MDPSGTHDLATALRTIVGNVTIRTLAGADLTGTATLTSNDHSCTLVAGTTTWTIPLDAIVAVGDAP